MALEYHWEDYEIGQSFQTGGRTLTDADIRLFLGATDATHPAHVDREYCKHHPFGRPTIPGALTLGAVDGLVVRYLVSQKINIAHYGYDKIRFLKPVYPGDTLTLIATVATKKEKNNEFGIISFNYEVKNQDNELVAVMTDLQMIEKKNKNDPMEAHNEQ